MADIALVDRTACERREDRCPPVDSALLPHVQPALEERHSTGVEADYPSLVAVAVLNDEAARSKVKILGLEGENLSDPQARSPGQGDEGAIPDPGRGSVRAHLQQSFDLVRREQKQARRFRIKGRSKMTKTQLKTAIARQRHM